MLTNENHFRAMTFTALRRVMARRFLEGSHIVPASYWQGQDISTRPEMISHELAFVSFNLNLAGIESLEHWRGDMKPNLPWADDHFEERVCGVPINPGTEWANWPWAASADKFRHDAMFNHNYMERYWPKYAGKLGAAVTAEEFEAAAMMADDAVQPHFGIRGSYGDLDDVIDLLLRDPLTRQAWLPIFFPEDTGDANDGRKPCTLGYQFIRRGAEFSIFYPLRSCDFVRHFADDAYLATRLLLWVLNRLRERNPTEWDGVRVASLAMHCTSLHIFKNDFIKLQQEGTL